ncbi:MAG: M28 family peptidase [Cytophagales bacterium]|nr:M28 family peptidase [Bernardetiaceae bacterium]MDW8204923.1 M28 family peptidase [Cytophagales bacterium]
MKTNIFRLILLLACTCQAVAQTFPSERLLEDLKTLASVELEGRRTGTQGAVKARLFIQKRFAEIGLKPAFGKSYEQPFWVKNQKEAIEGVNLAGFIAGTKKNKQWIVICAHYDHLGKVGSTVFPGADDNASGVAALLALAEYFTKKPPQHNLLFLTPDAEEMGLKGAKHFLKNLPFPIEQLALHINMDMISRSNKNELFAVGTYHYPVLKKILAQYVAKGFKLSFGHDHPQHPTQDDWSNASDHAPFHQQGIPFVYFGVEDHEDYHQPTDTFERIHPTFFSAVVAGIAECVHLLDQHLNNIHKQKSQHP